MGKKSALISVEFNAETNELTFNVGTAEPISLAIGELSEELKTRALLHGLVQKVSDAAAMPKSELSGDTNADAITKRNAMAAVATRLVSGDWSKRAGDGTSGPVAGLLYLAFAEYVEVMATKKKKPVPNADEIRKVYDSKSRKEQLALRNVPAIATIIARIKSERGTSADSIDPTDLLAELGI